MIRLIEPGGASKSAVGTSLTRRSSAVRSSARQVPPQRLDESPIPHAGVFYGQTPGLFCSFQASHRAVSARAGRFAAREGSFPLRGGEGQSAVSA